MTGFQPVAPQPEPIALTVRTFHRKTQFIMSTNLQRILKAMLILILVAGLGFGGVFAAAWMWPLPKGQGLAYVAHPFLALIGCAVAAIAAAVAGVFYPEQWGWCLAGGLALTWSISAMIFMTA